jgi:hypothetical protein
MLDYNTGGGTALRPRTTEPTKKSTSRNYSFGALDYNMSGGTALKTTGSKEVAPVKSSVTDFFNNLKLNPDYKHLQGGSR